MSKETKRIDVIAEEAAEWSISLKDGDAKSKAAFAAWLRTSPEHVKEFLSIATLWDALLELAAQPSVAELVELASANTNVVALTDPVISVPKALSETTRSKRRIIPWSIAAGVAVMIVGGALTFISPPEDPNRYTTAIGEQMSLSLDDGSIVMINTQSTLRIAYSEDFRDIFLEKGEALFDVAKNPERPFRVITEHAIIQAIGTQFNVRQVNGDIMVTVVEGIVDVAATNPRSQAGDVAHLTSVDDPLPAIKRSVMLTVGQQARVRSRSGDVAIVDTTVYKAISWQQRRLVFESLSLKDVVDEFNRYNDPPLLIDDVDLKQLPISGVFRSNDRESFVKFLSEMQLAKSHTRSDGTIVLRGVQSD